MRNASWGSVGVVCRSVLDQPRTKAAGAKVNREVARRSLVAVGVLLVAQAAVAQVVPRETKLVGAGTMEAWGGGSSLSTGYSVTISADGKTIVIGGEGDGAARVFARARGGWSQQAGIPTPSDATASGRGDGCVVAVSADGNTVIVGCPQDDDGVGAAWVFAREGGVWTQQGPKLIGTDASRSARQGYSVAISSDGNTAIVGGPADGVEPNGNIGLGAAWVYFRTGGAWTQQGPKLVGSGVVGGWALQGYSVALSADGDTAIIGGPWDDSDWDTGCVGAAWVFTRSDGKWMQQGNKLVGSDYDGPHRPHQGTSVALSADGTTALVGGPHDHGGVSTGDMGATWVYTRSRDVWTQQGPKLVGSGAVGRAHQGASVALSGDGRTAIIGGPSHDSLGGGTWVFTSSNGFWAQRGDKLVGSGTSGPAQQGISVAMTPNASTFIVGAPFDGDGGAAWVFSTESSSWVPVVANASGFNGAEWHSDLGLLNTGDTTANVRLNYAGDGGVASDTTYVPPGVQSILTDVVGQLGVSGVGALEIVADQPLRITARTYNQMSSDAGCFGGGTQGQELPVLASGDGLKAGQGAYLPGLIENDRYRSNIGLFNTGDEPATALVELFDGAGTKLAEYAVTLAHGRWQQALQPFASVAGISSMDRGYARVTAQSGSGVFAVASVIDNLTNDPTTITMQR